MPIPKTPLSENTADTHIGTRPAGAVVGNVIAVVVVFVALAVGTYALFRLGGPGTSSATTSARFQLDLTAQMDVPAKLLQYTEQRRIPISLNAPKSVAVGPHGRLFVAGDESIEVLAPDGAATRITLDGPPTCLTAVAPDATDQSGTDNVLLYVGVNNRVVVLDRTGEIVRNWPAGDSDSVLTSIAVAGQDVFVADAGQRVVRHYDTSGKLIGTIGKPDPDRQMPGFVIPSPYFDLVVDQDEILHVVNPGMRRIEAYDSDGALQSFWGRGGSALADFFGCCNPAHLAIMPDGRFITAEKGIPRVKVYSPGGELLQVVAGPRQLGITAAALGDARGNQKERVFDVAVDGSGNVLVLDPRRRTIIVFALRTQKS